MEPLALFATVLAAITRIRKLADRAKENTTDCKKLSERLNAFVPNLRALEQREKDRKSNQSATSAPATSGSASKAIESLVKVVADAEKLVFEFADTYWFERMTGPRGTNLEFEAEFKRLNLEIDRCNWDLGLNLQISSHDRMDRLESLLQHNANMLDALGDAYLGYRGNEVDNLREARERLLEKCTFKSDRSAIDDMITGSFAAEPVSTLDISQVNYNTKDKKTRVSQVADLSMWRGTYNSDKVVLKKVDLQSYTTGDARKHLRQTYMKEEFCHRSLAHPKIIRCYGAHFAYDEVILVFEAPDLAGTVRDYLKSLDTQLEPRRALSFASDVAAGIQYLHFRGISHRDINTHASLVIAGGGTTVKISNLSLAKKVRVSSVASESKRGKSALQPPEIITHKPDDTSKTIRWGKVDVFAFAFVVYELVTRREPWAGTDSSQQVQSDILAGKRPSMDPSIVKANTYLINLARRCWQSSPGKRPSFTDGVVVRDLEQAAAAMTTSP